MEIGRQIKRYRTELHLSQEELAEKIYVTRQTISNWENDRNYPDINSLLLLSTLFDISLDILVKGDLEEMREQVKAEDIKKLKSDSMVYTVLLIAAVITAIPLFWCLKWIGIVIWAVLYGITMYYAVRIEKQKRAYDIHTYKEILAFMEGRRLDDIRKNQEYGKRPYQKVLLAIAAAGIAGVVAAVMGAVMGFLG